MVNAVNLSSLVQKIQDERAAVALNIFLDRPPTDQMTDLQQMVDKDVLLRRFILSNVSTYKVTHQNCKKPPIEFLQFRQVVGCC